MTNDEKGLCAANKRDWENIGIKLSVCCVHLQLAQVVAHAEEQRHLTFI